MKTIELVTDVEIKNAWGNANFGSVPERDVLKYGLLKCACGYYQGYTITTILGQLGLVVGSYDLTAKGRLYLWECFRENTTL